MISIRQTTRFLLFAIILWLAGNCAKVAPPPGGPVDDTAPVVLATEPPDGSVGITPPHRLAIHFSERMNERTVERNLKIHPEPEWVSLSWVRSEIIVDSTLREVRTLLIETDRTTEESDYSDGVVTVTVSGYSEDRRRNGLKGPYLFSFSAGDSIPPGKISGKVIGAKKDSKASPIIVQALHPGTESDKGDQLLIETQAGRDGGFVVSPLPVGTDHPVILFAFRDDNLNGVVDFDFEYYGRSDTLRLDSGEPILDSLSIKMVTADTPGSLAGRVTVSHAPDSTILRLESLTDTLFLEQTSPDTLGDFSFSKVPAGEYRLEALEGDTEDIRREGAAGALRTLGSIAVSIEPGEEVKQADLPVPREDLPPDYVGARKPPPAEAAESDTTGSNVDGTGEEQAPEVQE